MACALTKETSPRLPRLISRGDSGDQNMACALTSRRRLRDLLETEKVSPQKNWTCLNFPRLPGDPASLRNQRRLESPPSLQASEIGPLGNLGRVDCTLLKLQTSINILPFWLSASSNIYCLIFIYFIESTHSCGVIFGRGKKKFIFVLKYPRMPHVLTYFRLESKSPIFLS